MDIVDSMIYYTKEVSPRMWQVFAMLHGILMEEGPDCFMDMQSCLEDFAQFGHERLLNDPQLNAMFLDVLVIMFKKAEDMEMEMKGAARVCINLILYASQRCVNMIPNFLNSIFEVFAKCLTPVKVKSNKKKSKMAAAARPYDCSLPSSTLAALLAMFFASMYTNVGPTLKFLMQHEQAAQVLMYLLTHEMGCVTKIPDRKLAILAATALFQFPMANVPPSLHALPAAFLKATRLAFDDYLEAETELEEMVKAYDSDQSEDEEDDEDEDIDDGEAMGAESARGRRHQQDADEDEEDGAFVPGEEEDDVEGREDAEYLEMLRREERHQGALHGRGPFSGAEEEFESDDDEFDDDDDYDLEGAYEEIFWELPIDDIDPYIVFRELLQGCSFLIVTDATLLLTLFM